jgi:hypothetical protein
MLIAVLALALPSQSASAQIATGNANAANAAAANGGTLVPGVGTLPGQTQLTPQQLMGIAQLRALQSRGRGRGVRTGYPQFVPMGPQNMMSPPVLNSSQGTGGEAKTSTQRRMEARQAREEQKRAARDDAKAKGAAKGKNAKNVKNVKAKNAKVAQKAEAEPQAK